jgi:VRR-NUC domain
MYVDQALHLARLLTRHQHALLLLPQVKGPNDRLSDTQIAWLRILTAGGVDACVCNVLESNKKSAAADSASSSDEL